MTSQPNHTMQWMGASRLAQLQFGSAWRLAPTTDGGRSKYDTLRNPE
jgi:hypothetical protein